MGSLGIWDYTIIVTDLVFGNRHRIYILKEGVPKQRSYFWGTISAVVDDYDID